MLRAVQIPLLKGLAFVITLAAGLSLVPSVGAAPPWATLVPFRKIDADPNKSYELEENHGPWMIMAASFAGSTAEQHVSQDVRFHEADRGVGLQPLRRPAADALYEQPEVRGDRRARRQLCIRR
jgi:hypothetical protein